jgi:hypothetical protein
MPGQPFRSKLEPFIEFITQERRMRSTWKAIADAIKAKGTPCTPQGIQDYFKRRRTLRMPLGFEPAHTAKRSLGSLSPEPSEEITQLR